MFFENNVTMFVYEILQRIGGTSQSTANYYAEVEDVELQAISKNGTSVPLRPQFHRVSEWLSSDANALPQQLQSMFQFGKVVVSRRPNGTYQVILLNVPLGDYGLEIGADTIDFIQQTIL